MPDRTVKNCPRCNSVATQPFDFYFQFSPEYLEYPEMSLKSCVRKLSSAKNRKDIRVCPNGNCQDFSNCMQKTVQLYKDLALGSKFHAEATQNSSAKLISYFGLSNIHRKSWI